MKGFVKISFFVLAAFLATGTARPQSGARKKNAPPKQEKTTPAEPDASPTPEPAAPSKNPAKKNGRPDAADRTEPNRTTDKDEKPPAPDAAFSNGYRYEFAQPNFTVKSVVIEHDENGNGKITFEKKDYGEPVSDPLRLSAVTMEKLRELYRTLNFLDSTETYQSPERDYKHLGTVKIERRADGKNRTAEFNWTENLTARALADEYRRIGNQWVWAFDIQLARENQPLEAPGLMDALDALIRRGEISDPPQMLAFLRELGNDERIPLMARNRAAKIIKEIEKKAAK